MDQGSTKKRSVVHNFAPTVNKFCVMWEGQAPPPQDTKFGNCRCEIVGRRVIFIWDLIHGSSWSGLIKAEPGDTMGEGISSHGTDLYIQKHSGFSTFRPIGLSPGSCQASLGLGSISRYFEQILFMIYDIWVPSLTKMNWCYDMDN